MASPLTARKGTGRPPKLTATHKRQVFRWINGKNPLQYGFDSGLWTRAIVRELIVKKCGICLSITSVGTVLAERNLTPQKPLQKGEKLEERVHHQLQAIADDAKLVRSFFTHPSVAYTSDY